MRLILASKNFAAHKHVSHIGLGVAAVNTSKSLIVQGIPTEVWPIIDAVHLRQLLNLSNSKPGAPITHVVISAPWIPTAQLQQFTAMFPGIQFAVNCHSNVGFLQADPNGVALFRQAIDLEMGVANFKVAGNSQKFCDWVYGAYSSPCAYLPNLYFLDSATSANKPMYNGGTLRIGCFGATRPLKNFMSAVGAAIQISNELNVATEIYLSSGRTEGGGDTILNAARALVAGLPLVKLIEAGWNAWPQHRTLVRSMHLLLQPSYTESFNMVTADGIAEGVPSVVSEAIEWAPAHWKAEVDDVEDIARVGRALLFDPHAARHGLRALKQHNAHGVNAWKQYLGVD